MNVSVGVSTSSPGPTPRIFSARCSAAVPLESAAACAMPTRAANSRSNASTCGPSGAIQLLAIASATSFCSSPPTQGGER